METEMVERFVRAAIQGKRLLQFRYERAVRVVEPHRFGYGASGEAMMLAWAGQGECGEGWQEFRLGGISGISIIGGASLAPRQSWPSNTMMHRIECQVAEAAAETA